MYQGLKRRQADKAARVAALSSGSRQSDAPASKASGHLLRSTSATTGRAGEASVSQCSPS